MVRENNHLPPNLNKRILADTMMEISENCKKNKNYTCNFIKLYKKNLFAGAINANQSSNENLSGWVIIPSYSNDPNGFEDNVKRLQTLSHDNWCTKTYNAEPYLREGDFHILFENGKPKLGVRFKNDIIQEIQGENNNSKIPIKYLEIAKKYVKNYSLGENAIYQFNQAELAKAEIEKLKSELKKRGVDFETCSTKELFDILNIEYKENEAGKLILKQYRQPSENVSFYDLGIDENKLFEDIVEIDGDITFRDSTVSNLGNLTIIKGNADFRESRVVDLGNLHEIWGNADFKQSVMPSLSKLKIIKGNADFKDSKVVSLADLEEIGGNAIFCVSKIKDMGNLQIIGKNADFKFSFMESLGKLRIIKGDADFNVSKLKDLGDIESVEGNILIHPVIAQRLGIEKLKSICANFNIE